MAGKGPPPKESSRRVRRNKAATPARAPRTARRRGSIPGLPIRPCFCVERKPKSGVCRECKGTKILAWHNLTVIWWRQVWTSPFASNYLEMDQQALINIAELQDAVNWNARDMKAQTELRLQRNAFGLTPLSRRGLQWEIVPEDPDTTGDAPPPPGDESSNILEFLSPRKQA